MRGFKNNMTVCPLIVCKLRTKGIKAEVPKIVKKTKKIHVKTSCSKTEKDLALRSPNFQQQTSYCRSLCSLSFTKDI